MPLIASTRDIDFDERLDALTRQRRQSVDDAEAASAAIAAAVREGGDAALIELTRRHDHCDLAGESLRYDVADIDARAAQADDDDVEALTQAAERIRAFHERQLPRARTWHDDTGARLGWRWTPVDSAGLYVPGGAASYPSSVLMNAIPARVAGVERLVMAVPPSSEHLGPLVFCAAQLTGIDCIYRVGGAQAIAALAYGTESIDPVDMIAGPGNAYVAAAKRHIVGQAGIDMIAGPSEVLVIAKNGVDPTWVAVDLMAQAEHDERAQAILVTDSVVLRDRVVGEVKRLLADAPRPQAAASWRDFGAAIIVRDLAEAVALSNRLAPEHLELMVDDPDRLLDEVRHAGAVFMGPWTPEAIGDYVAGPSHVLPTGGTARFASGLSVLSFMKRMTITQFSPEAMAKCGPSAARLADAEGLHAHAMSVRLRLGGSRQR